MFDEAAVSTTESEDPTGDFLGSLPGSYREAYSASDAAEHSDIAARRATKTAHLELWRTFPNGLFVVCVVADDKPGLLSTICRAFVAHDLDIVSAQIHCRTRGGGLPAEAFDLFWLRFRRGVEAGTTLEPEGIRALSRTLEESVTDDTFGTLAQAGGANDDQKITSMAPARIFFDTAAMRRGEYVLSVETLDAPGLLLAITLALHRQGLEIVSSAVHTQGRTASDLFTVRDFTGKPLSAERLAAVRQAVVDAVRRLERRSDFPPR